LTAARRAAQRRASTLAARVRLYCAALRLKAYLPVEMAARLAQMPAELIPPEHPSHAAVLESADPMPRNVRTGVAAARCGDAAGEAGEVAGLAQMLVELMRRSNRSRAAVLENADRMPCTVRTAVEGAGRGDGVGGAGGAARVARVVMARRPGHSAQVVVLRNADPMPCTVRTGAKGAGRGVANRKAATGRAGRAARLALRVRELERQAALAEAHSQAPWRQAIAFARAAKRAARQARGRVLAVKRAGRERAAAGAGVPRSAAVHGATSGARAERGGSNTVLADVVRCADRRGWPGLGHGERKQGAEYAALFRPTAYRPPSVT
jgi:hypothetical protein